ncbi:hypothetical protein JTB14_034813 [Gonioctena quinquepunctata]|nr:hypothetical protein JTB14_034813 [Gonioctena quinquepunctata]
MKRYKNSLEGKENEPKGDQTISADSSSKVSAIGDRSCVPNVIQQLPDEPSSKQKSKSPLSEAQVHSTPMKQSISISPKSSELTPNGIINLFEKKLSNSTERLFR